MKRIISVFLIIFLLAACGGSIAIAHYAWAQGEAEGESDTGSSDSDTGSADSDTGSGDSDVGQSTTGGGIFTNPLKDGVDTLQGLLGLILDVMVQIGMVVITIAIIYAGFLYTTARGNPTQISKAHTVIVGVLIGSAIILGAYVIAQVLKDTVNDLKEGVFIEKYLV
jgi:hypothetical protein